jgi:osmotically-inducible protein OsmY
VKKYLCALVIAAAVAGLGQAASVAASGAAVSKPPPVKTSAAQRVLPDAQIERNIRAKLAKSKMSGTEHFTVSVENGVATLQGKTNVIQHKGVATRLAKSGGAIAVHNQIQVSDEAKAKAAAKLAKYRSGQAEPVRATVLQASPGK